MEYSLSRFGFLWSILEPLGIILVYSIIFPLVLGVDFYSFVLFFMAGFIPHRFLQDGLMGTTHCLVDHKSILNEVNIKEEIVPISITISKTIQFLIQCLIFFSIIFISGVIPGIYFIFFPLLVIIHFFMVLGFGMHLSVTFVNMRDLEHILNVLFEALMFLTPIIYRITTIPGIFRDIYLLNPQSRLILLYQETLLKRVGDPAVFLDFLPNLIILLLFSLGVLFIGYFSFKRRKKKVIGEI